MEGSPSRPPLQDFCKNAQWRAKKLRERGSSTARPTEKGGGGLPIRSRFGRFGRFRRVVSCRFGRFRSRFADFLLSFRADSVDSVDSVDFGASISARRVNSDHRGRCRSQGANTKKSPIPQWGNRASAIARCRALLTFRKLLFQVHVQALETFGQVLRVDFAL